MLILLPISSTYSYEAHGFLSSFGVSIFVISLFLMFLSSTIYHSMAYGSTHKYVLRIIDHSMIYVAIAGSYTPVVLTLMNNWFGYLIIAIQWGTTIFGILMVTGGLCYTVGAGFYAKKKPYFHMIWHLFILAASALQYIAIVYYM